MCVTLFWDTFYWGFKWPWRKRDRGTRKKGFTLLILLFYCARVCACVCVCTNLLSVAVKIDKIYLKVQVIWLLFEKKKLQRRKDNKQYTVKFNAVACKCCKIKCSRVIFNCVVHSWSLLFLKHIRMRELIVIYCLNWFNVLFVINEQIYCLKNNILLFSII